MLGLGRFGARGMTSCLEMVCASVVVMEEREEKAVGIMWFLSRRM